MKRKFTNLIGNEEYPSPNDEPPEARHGGGKKSVDGSDGRYANQVPETEKKLEITDNPIKKIKMKLDEIS